VSKTVSGVSQMSQTSVSQTSVSQTSISQTGVSQTSISQTSMSQTGVSQTSISGVSNMVGSGHDGVVGKRGVVDQMRSRERLRDRGMSIKNSGLTLDDSGVSSKMLSSGSGYFGGYLRGSWGNSSVDGGNEGLGVEGRSNREGIIVNGKTRILNTESVSISDVSDSLQNVVGVDIRVSSVDSSISVSDLLLHGVDVGVSVVEVSELILGVELASWGVVGSGGGGVSVMSGIPDSSVSVSGVQGAQVDGLISGQANGQKGRYCDEESHDVLPSV